MKKAYNIYAKFRILGKGNGLLRDIRVDLKATWLPSF
jgi:hypothetical protein